MHIFCAWSFPLVKNYLADSTLNTKKEIINANDIAFKIISKPQVYLKSIDVYLKDSNAYGNVYFSNYFVWQGIVREAWFSDCIFENMLDLKGCFVTKNAYNEYCSPVFPFQKIKGELKVESMRKSSFKLVFNFYDSKDVIVSKGYQTVLYTDKNGKILKLPEDIKEKMLRYA